VGEASSAERDAALLGYFKSRKSMGQVIHRFFGDPGLQVAAARYAGPEHQAAIALLRERLADPGFAPALSPLERAEIELLAAAPLDFVSCVARARAGVDYRLDQSAGPRRKSIGPSSSDAVVLPRSSSQQHRLLLRDAKVEYADSR
jgi:hypothetical protein